jgi:hypothetical protein
MIMDFLCLQIGISYTNVFFMFANCVVRANKKVRGLWPNLGRP